MTDERHPLYRLALKVERERIPVATISGGMHRLDLTVAEYQQLRKLIPKGLPGSDAGLKQEQAMDWQPIETAPMDGSAIWLLVDGHPYIGFGEPKNWLCKTDRWNVKATFKRRPEIERRERDLSDEIYGCYGLDVKPTHWMPLPAPPTT